MEAYPGYLGLLKWSLAQSDGTSTPSASRMTEDDKAWLKEAFEALTVDEAKRMKELLAVLREEDCEERVEDKEAAFDELVFYGESIDNARDMCTLGGLHAVGPMLASQFPALRAAAANLVAVICQNNPKVQTSCLLARFMPVLMHMTANDPEVSVRLKALLGLSCLVRDHAEALTEFLAADGFSVIVAVLELPAEVRLHRRAMFFLRHLAATSPHVCAALTRERSTVLQTVALCLLSEDDDLRDNAWHVFHELLACSGPAAEPMLALAAPPDSGAGSAVLVMDTPASPVVMAAPVDVVPPFYERLGVCCAEPVKLKQAVTSRLATLGALPPDEQERLASEREVCEALANLLQGV